VTGCCRGGRRRGREGNRGVVLRRSSSGCGHGLGGETGDVAEQGEGRTPTRCWVSRSPISSRSGNARRVLQLLVRAWCLLPKHTTILPRLFHPFLPFHRCRRRRFIPSPRRRRSEVVALVQRVRSTASTHPRRLRRLMTALSARLEVGLTVGGWGGEGEAERGGRRRGGVEKEEEGAQAVED